MMLLFGLTVGVICIAGFNYAVKNLPPLVFSASALVDPGLTGVISWICGIEGVPNEPTVVGGVIIVVGVYLISSVDSGKSADVETNEVSDKLIVNHDIEMASLLSAHSGVVYGATTTDAGVL
jgi:drug/metabolite transporter (DMT)-like permease